jgi:WD40 repeat protein
VDGVAVTPDGRFAVSAAEDHTLKVWDLHSGQLVHTLEGHTSGVYGVAVTSDGRFAVSASDDKTLKIWNLRSGQGALELVTDVQLRCCAIVRDGEAIVTGDWMGVVHFVEWVRWD